MSKEDNKEVFYRYVENPANNCVLTLWIKHGDKKDNKGVINYSWALCAEGDKSNNTKEFLFKNKDLIEFIDKVENMKSSKVRDERKFANLVSCFINKRFVDFFGVFDSVSKKKAKKIIEERIADGEVYSVEVELDEFGRLKDLISDVIIEDMLKKFPNFSKRWLV